MARQKVKDSTNVIMYVVIRDSVTGALETGFDVTTLQFQYIRTGEEPSVAANVSLLGATNGPHIDNAAIEIDPTNSKGVCRVDFPDAAFAAGVDAVELSVTGAGFDISPKEIELVNALNDPTVAAIAAAVMGSNVDSPLDVTETLTVLLALAVAKKIEVFGSTYIFKDQSGNTKVTITYDAATGTAVIS